MLQPISRRPLQKFDSRNSLGTQPHAFFQLSAVGAEGLEIFRGFVVTSNARSYTGTLLKISTSLVLPEG